MVALGCRTQWDLDRSGDLHSSFRDFQRSSGVRTRTRRGRRMVKRRDGAREMGSRFIFCAPATPFLFFSRCPSLDGRRLWTTLQTSNPLFALGVSYNSPLVLGFYRHSPCVTNNSIICENYISSPPCLSLQRSKKLSAGSDCDSELPRHDIHHSLPKVHPVQFAVGDLIRGAFARNASAPSFTAPPRRSNLHRSLGVQSFLLQNSGESTGAKRCARPAIDCIGVGNKSCIAWK